MSTRSSVRSLLTCPRTKCVTEEGMLESSTETDFPSGLHFGASHTLEPRRGKFRGDVRTVTLVELTPWSVKAIHQRKRRGGIDQTPNLWNAARMVGWLTTATSYGASKFNQKWVKHWKGVRQRKP